MNSNKKFDMKKWTSLLVLCCGTGVIFQLPISGIHFIFLLVEALNLSNEEFGALSTSYATISMICYFFGGWIADRVSLGEAADSLPSYPRAWWDFYSTFPSYGAP